MNRPWATSRRILSYLIPGIVASYLWCNLIAPHLFFMALDRAVFSYVLVSEDALSWAHYLYLSGANIGKWLRADVRSGVPVRELLHVEDWRTEYWRGYFVTRILPTGKRSLDENRAEHLVNSLLAVIGEGGILVPFPKQRLVLLEKIISWGVDVNRPGVGMITPFHAAMCFNRIEVLDILVQHGLRLNDVQIFEGIECAIMNKSMRSLEWVLDLELVPDTITQRDQHIIDGGVIKYDIPAHSNLIHVACYLENIQAAEMLRTRTKLSLEQKNENGKTPSDICLFN